MQRVRFNRVLPATLGVSMLLGTSSVRGQIIDETPLPVNYFDVLDLPARVDQPKLVKSENRYALNCAVANRANEELLGLRLDLLVLDPDGKLRARLSWNEESRVASYSIKVFAFQPPIKVRVQSTDRLFLTVGEVIGRENIWHVVEGDKALRAFSRGQSQIMPKVQTVANRADTREGPRVFPREKKY